MVGRSGGFCGRGPRGLGQGKTVSWVGAWLGDPAWGFSGWDFLSGFPVRCMGWWDVRVGGRS